MNIENAKTLVDQLKRLPDEKFWMADYIVHPNEFDHIGIPRDKSCGTIACIAGWACLLNGGPAYDNGGDAFDWAKKWLGLNSGEAENLFHGRWVGWGVDLKNVTRSEAIVQLERLIAAETVDA